MPPWAGKQHEWRLKRKRREADWVCPDCGSKIDGMGKMRPDYPTVGKMEFHGIPRDCRAAMAAAVMST